MTISRFSVAMLLIGSIGPAANGSAAVLRVPQDHKTIQSAVDAAKPGDTVLVSPGTYKEQIRLGEGVTLKSAGGDAEGELGLARAEATILEGPGKQTKAPGVIMAEGAVLDGFTVTNVGVYDEAVWNRHHATYGAELADNQGAVGTGTGFPAVGCQGVNCTIRYNIVRHNGHAGIGIRGAKGKKVSPRVYRNVVYRNMGGGIGSSDGSTATIEENIGFQNLRAAIGSRNASPLIINNVCYENVRAGIGQREGAKPILRGNKCYRNRRAGIGVRMEGTSPIIENNDCYENEMAGIGNRDGATPIIRNNRCYRNKMSGIGSRSGAQALIENNECYENDMAGIGTRLGAVPLIRNNRCYRNKMSGIGARENARPIIEGNECFENKMAGIGAREGAAPVIRDNRCYHNAMAGIGSRLGARAVILENACYGNLMAGLGSREGAAPVILRNRCYKNKMAGI
ncbi:MAG: right-handed parallel beta-helix repeat-containing protein, partial [Planctomycetales bacterium]